MTQDDFTLESEFDNELALLAARPAKARIPKIVLPRKEIWSCGGGTQSVAIAALIVQGKLPKPDIAVIVDTGREKNSTWQYCDEVLIPNLAAVGVILHRIHRADWNAPWSVPVGGLFATSGQLMIPAFSGQTEKGGKLTNFCSSAWKQEVHDRWLSQVHKIKPSNRRKWIGFSLDEPRRFMKMIDEPDIRLPLVHDVPMRRQDCINLVMREMGWPEPPRSNCWMCPNQGDDEWLETLRNRPEEFEAAIKLEKQVREIDPHAYLHRQCVPLDQVDWSKQQTDFYRACNSGECFV